MEQMIQNASLIFLRYIHLFAFLLCSVAAVVAFKKKLIFLGTGLLFLALPPAYNIVYNFSLLSGGYWPEKHWDTFLVVKDCIETAGYTLILIHVFKAKRK